MSRSVLSSCRPILFFCTHSQLGWRRLYLDSMLSLRPIAINSDFTSSFSTWPSSGCLLQPSAPTHWFATVFLHMFRRVAAERLISNWWGPLTSKFQKPTFPGMGDHATACTGMELQHRFIFVIGELLWSLFGCKREATRASKRWRGSRMGTVTNQGAAWMDSDRSVSDPWSGTPSASYLACRCSACRALEEEVITRLDISLRRRWFKSEIQFRLEFIQHKLLWLVPKVVLFYRAGHSSEEMWPIIWRMSHTHRSTLGAPRSGCVSVRGSTYTLDCSELVYSSNAFPSDSNQTRLNLRVRLLPGGEVNVKCLSTARINHTLSQLVMIKGGRQ